MPSEKVLEAKKAQVAETVEILKAAQTGVLVDYRGLNVEEDTELRRKLREANVKYFVIKNTLLRLAAKEVGLDALDEALHGPTAIAVSSEDAVAPAKVIADFAKENDKLEIKTGFMDGAVISLDEVNKLGTTVIVVTHNPDVVDMMQKRVIMMKDGKLIHDESKGGYLYERY